MKKFLDWAKSKYTKMGVAVSAAAVALVSSASAAEEAGAGAGTDVVDTVASSMTTAISGFAGKAASILGTIVVAAIPIAGAIWLARKAFGWFKSTAK